MQTDTLSDKPFTDDFPRSLNREAYQQFLQEACSRSEVETIIFSFPVLFDDPLHWFEQNRADAAFQYYWEKPAASRAIAACGASTLITAEGVNRFTETQQQIENVRGQLVHFDSLTGDVDTEALFVGGFSFFNDPGTGSWKEFHPALLTLPECIVFKNGDHTIGRIAVQLHERETPERLHQVITRKLNRFSLPAGNTAAGPAVYSSRQNILPKPSSRADKYTEWIQLVEKAKEAIFQNKLKKVVLGRLLKLEAPAGHDPVATLRQLRTQYPKCASFLLKNKGSATFIGSSPERLLSTDGRQFQTDALAGSIGRGSTDQHDQQLEEELLGSFKDQEEHSFVLNDIKKWLDPFVSELEATDHPIIKKLANVQHLYSPVNGLMNENTSPLTLLGQLHPTPAVGGTPRNRALRYIDEHEPFARGWFAAPVGWIDTGGRSEFNVAIRSGLLKNNKATLFAGCGIVAESDSETEWQETNLKFAPMLSALHYD